MVVTGGAVTATRTTGLLSGILTHAKQKGLSVPILPLGCLERRQKAQPPPAILTRLMVAGVSQAMRTLAGFIPIFAKDQIDDLASNTVADLVRVALRKLFKTSDYGGL